MVRVIVGHKIDDYQVEVSDQGEKRLRDEFREMPEAEKAPDEI
jgi:hypothetical protein